MLIEELQGSPNHWNQLSHGPTKANCCPQSCPHRAYSGPVCTQIRARNVNKSTAITPIGNEHKGGALEARFWGISINSLLPKLVFTATLLDVLVYFVFNRIPLFSATVNKNVPISLIPLFSEFCDNIINDLGCLLP